MSDKPLSIEETQRALRRKWTADDISAVIKSVRDGNPDVEQVKRLLMDFCMRAYELRDYSGPSNAPTVIEFVAERILLYLSKPELDLECALGLRRSGQGKKPAKDTKRNHERIAARVLDLMWPTLAQDFECDDLCENLDDAMRFSRSSPGKTRDQAVDEIAKEEKLSPSSVRDIYSENKTEAVKLLLYRHLLDPDFLVPDSST